MEICFAKLLKRVIVGLIRIREIVQIAAGSFEDEGEGEDVKLKFLKAGKLI